MPTMYADLHLHTVLSACAEVEMIPPLIVRRALELGLTLLAVTDHNTAANCAGVMAAAEGTGLVILPGMELATAEELHMLCLFETLEQALTWQGIVFDHLPNLPNNEDLFGGQYVVDGQGGYIRTEARLLAAPSDLSLAESVHRVTELGGLAIPAHIDRPMFSLFASLGFVPPGLPVPALEIFRHTEPRALLAQHPEIAPYALVRDGDAHQLSDMRQGIAFEADAPSFAALRGALESRTHRLVRGNSTTVSP
jgi:3',5'-nucleoside bisphosphate phosphatase